MAKAQTYSYEANIRLLTMVAIIIVGTNLQDRKTTLVGKLIKLNDILHRELDAKRHNVRSG